MHLNGHNNGQQKRKPLFTLGTVVMTPGASETLKPHHPLAFKLLARHVTGDWSEMAAEDQKANQDALSGGSRVFSAYGLPDGGRVWIITEWDRSATTFLLPDEY